MRYTTRAAKSDAPTAAHNSKSVDNVANVFIKVETNGTGKGYKTVVGIFWFEAFCD